MLLRMNLLLAAGVGVPNAVTAAGVGLHVQPVNHEIVATSKAGNRLLSRARLLSEDDNESQQSGDGISWIAGYSLNFESCKTLIQQNFDKDGDNNNKNGNNYDERNDGMYSSRLVEFRLCPTRENNWWSSYYSSSSRRSSNGCSDNCAQSSGLYAVPLEDFLQIYMETERQEQEENCERVRENCYYDDESACYAKAGLDYCDEGEKDEGEEKFEIEEYLQCGEIKNKENDNDNNENNYDLYNYYSNWYKCYNEECNLYAGATCSSDGTGIVLSTFLDEDCTTEAPQGAYEAMNNGASLPFSSGYLVSTSSKCRSCQMTRENSNDNGNNNNNNNNKDNNDEMEISDMCEQLYENALKCEENVTDATYPSTSACYYLKTILPALDELAKMQRSSSYSSVVYWSLAPVLALGSVGGWMYMKKKRQNSSAVNLADQDMTVGAAPYAKA